VARIRGVAFRIIWRSVGTTLRREPQGHRDQPALRFEQNQTPTRRPSIPLFSPERRFLPEPRPQYLLLSYPDSLALARHLNFGETGTSGSAPVSVLDLAAGSAVWSIGIVQSSPRVIATAVDWPEVIPVTQKSVARFGLTPRYTFAPGDLASADFGSGHQDCLAFLRATTP
jgi:hypothetical protein